MPTVYPLNYQQTLDTNWAVAPGACTAMSYFIQRQDGQLAVFSPDISNTDATATFALTGSDHLHAKLFMQTDGTARFLTFRKQNIDEYTSTGTRTNRGTSYSASTAAWNATAWGNQIIAVNYLDAPQSSTGAGFTALSGSPPKARYIASNINFVVMADVDDSGSNVYTDMVWWSGIRNPNTWTPSQATQAGNIRLLDAPGPIRNIVPFGDKFIAFKESSIFVGTYIGPPYVFSWKLITASIGLTYPKAVAECDGKLFFAHFSGIYYFDGNTVRNIGLGVWSAPTESYGTADTVRMRADDIQGNIYIGVHSKTVAAFTQYKLYTYAYNCRTGLWARQGLICSSDSGANNPEQPIVYGTTAEYRAFLATPWGDRSGFAWIDNAASAKVSFGGRGASSGVPTFTTGRLGDNEQVPKATRVYFRLTSKDTSLISSATMQGYHNETDAAIDTTSTLTYNSDTDTLDGTLAAKFKTVTVTLTTGKEAIVAGLGTDAYPAGKR